MQIKRFEARTMTEALKLVKDELGPEAVILSAGSRRSDAPIADCTSCAATSTLLVRANWSVIRVVPSVLDEVIESMPSMVENCFSRGVATDDAMASGEAPGRVAVTEMVGKSTLGSSLTGSEK